MKSSVHFYVICQVIFPEFIHSSIDNIFSTQGTQFLSKIGKCGNISNSSVLFVFDYQQKNCLLMTALHFYLRILHVHSVYYCMPVSVTCKSLLNCHMWKYNEKVNIHWLSLFVEQSFRATCHSFKVFYNDMNGIVHYIILLRMKDIYQI